MPTVLRELDSSLHEIHCPLPSGTEAVYCRSPTAHCPQAVQQCIAGVPPPTALTQPDRELQCQLPPGSEVVHCRSQTAHCPKAVR